MNTIFQDTIAILKKPIVALGVLVVLCFVICGIYASEGKDGFLHNLQKSVSAVFVPVSSAGHSAKDGLMSLSDFMDQEITDSDSVAALKKENSQLKAKLSSMTKYKDEAQRLQKLLNIKDQYNAQGVCGHVIGSSSTAWSQTITANIGEENGVFHGQSVLGSCGLVGEVISTTANTATIRLITDPNSGVAVTVLQRNAPCILRGSLEGVLSLEGLEANIDVQIGDMVTTSGLGGSFCEGIAVGSVSQIINNTSGAGKKVIVSPLDTIDNIREVFIVINDQ